MSARSSTGMQTNVALALGYSGRPRSTPQSVNCLTCGTALDFPTDAIGRVREVCPRGCSARLLTPSGDPVLVERIARLLEDAKVENKAIEDKLEARFGRAICARRCCGVEFQKKSRNHKYCSNVCVGLDVGPRRGVTLGIAGRTGGGAPR